MESWESWHDSSMYIVSAPENHKRREGFSQRALWHDMVVFWFWHAKYNNVSKIHIDYYTNCVKERERSKSSGAGGEMRNII